MNRRNFVGNSVIASLSMALSGRLSALEADHPYRRNIGIQLYTLRGPVAQDLEATIKAVAGAGYQQVETYAFPHTMNMLQASRDAGLAVHSSHFLPNSVVEPPDEAMSAFQGILERAVETEVKHLVIPIVPPNLRKSLDDYKRVAEHCNKAAAMCREAGVTLSYHNHSFEFEPLEDGKSGFDVFIEEFSPEMKFEIDVFWVEVGGLDSVELIRKLKGRVTQLHLKDLADGQQLPDFQGMPKEAFKELGNGIIPMQPILTAAAEAGVEHCHVEQDHSPNPIASIRTSIRHLEGL